MYNPNPGRQDFQVQGITYYFNFQIWHPNDLKVTIDGQAVAFSVDILDQGGVVTLDYPSNGAVISIQRDLPITREVDYITNGDLRADTLDHDQDYQTTLIQDLSTKVGPVQGVGPQGPTGVAGPKGNPGPNGIDGTNGANGANGYRNIIINGNMSINQRDYNGTPQEGKYGYDRWKNVGSDIVQVIEAGSFAPNTDHVLSGVGIVTRVIKSPTGHWTITVPRNARKIQLEQNDQNIPTPFEFRPIQVELAMCQRYYQTYPKHCYLFMYNDVGTKKQVSLARTVTMRTLPTETVELNGGGSFDTSYSDEHTFHYRAKDLDAAKSSWLRNIVCDAEL